MTVAVACNLAEGVILGVDSAVTMENSQGQVVKIYENATKLFQLGDKSIGIAIFGMGALGTRNIGSYIREFEITNPNKVVTQNATVVDIVEELRKFFLQEYQKVVIPEVEKLKNKKFNEIPDKEKPILGLSVGGFSFGAYLSQVWEILIPLHKTPNSALLKRKEGDFGSNWFALYEPIFRYHKAYDESTLRDLKAYFAQLRGSPFTSSEDAAIMQILQKHEYIIPFAGMPLKEGITYVKFLIEMVINHHRFSVGASVVGGKARIGLVTYKGEKFQILDGG